MLMMEKSEPEPRTLPEARIVLLQFWEVRVWRHWLVSILSS